MRENRRVSNPFPGLRPFETDEYLLFFGREGQSDALVERLERARFLAVVGTSGSGKSSLVRAGLLPALRGGMMSGAGAGWRVAVSRPGHDPIGNLARELAAEGVLPGESGLERAEAEAVVEATLRRGSLGLVEAAYAARLAEREKLLVVVDQFEELFRFREARAGAAATDDGAAAFVKLLLEASRQRELPVYVVVTMRSDFLGDCAQFQGLPEAINDGQYLIPRMTRDERRVAIVGPARVARGKMSEPLVNRLLNDVGDNPDQLPILQHALMRTWDYWLNHRAGSEPVGLEHYLAVGTMTDALSMHADEAYNELPDERSRHVAELLFKALTERGADNREVRRPTSLREICEIAGASAEEVAAVVEVFRREGRSFLMPPPPAPLTPDTVIDISHESLIRNWARLRDWVKEEAEGARIYRRLADAAAAHGAGEGGLLDDVTIGWVNRWRERYHPNRAWGLRYHKGYDEALGYLEASEAASAARAEEGERQRQAEIERARREREQAEAFAEQQRRTARRMRGLALGMGVMFFVALAGGGYAYTMGTQARRSEREATAAKTRAEKLYKTLEETFTSEKKAKEDAQHQRDLAAQTAADLQEQTKIAKQNEQSARDEKKRADEQARIAASKEAEASKLAAKELEQRKKVEESAAQLRATIERNRWSREGLASFQRGQYDEALNAFEIVREGTQKEGELRDGRPVNTDIAVVHGWALANIGATQRRMGEPDKAVASYEHALAILEEVLDPDDPVRFDTYHGLAHAYHDTKQFDKAETYFKRALDFLEHNLAGKPSEVADALENVARLYRDLGQFEKAEPYFKRIIDLRKAEGEQRPEALDTLREVAQFYTAGGKYQNALSLYEDVLRIQEASNVSFDSVGALLDYFRATADTYSAMGEVRLRMGDDEQAEASFKLARRLQNVALKLRQFGAAGEHAANEGEAFRNMLKRSDVAADFEEIADLYTELRRHNNAARFYSLLAAAQESNGDLLGAEQSRLKGARILSEQLHDMQSAFLNYSEVIANLRSKKVPDSAPLVAEALAGLARIYTGESHDFVKAEEHLKAALAVLAEVPPSERSELATYATLADLAGLYKRLGREGECVAANRKRLEAASALLTKNPSNSSDEHGAPAENTPAQKVWEGDAYTEVFALYIRAVSDLSDSLAAWGKPEEANKVLGRLLDTRLDPAHVLDKGVLDSYADMLTRHAGVLASPDSATGLKPEDRVEAKLRAAREQKAEIEQITARQ